MKEIGDIAQRYEQLITEYNDYIGEMKRYEQKIKGEMSVLIDNYIYPKLQYCSKDGCESCPHGFSWYVTYSLKNKKLYGKYIGTKITKEVLKKYGLYKLYPKLKRIDRQIQYMNRTRKYYRNKISLISLVLNNSKESEINILYNYYQRLRCHDKKNKDRQIYQELIEHIRLYEQSQKSGNKSMREIGYVRLERIDSLLGDYLVKVEKRNGYDALKEAVLIYYTIKEFTERYPEYRGRYTEKITDLHLQIERIQSRV